MNKYLLIVILALLSIIGFGWQYINDLNEKWETAEANVKAYDDLLSESDSKAIAQQLTIAQLNYAKDSVLIEMKKVKEELKIKDKRLKSIQYTSSVITKTDTLVLNDTVFKEPSFELDTIAGDEWCRVRINLKYPSQIAVKPEVKSDKYLVVSLKKETVNPPKKFFVARWFQKKHKVLKLDVIERNPYVKNESSRFVQIIK